MKHPTQKSVFFQGLLEIRSKILIETLSSSNLTVSCEIPQY